MEKFKVPFSGFTAILTPLFIVIVILQHFGIGTLYLKFTLNEEPITGWPLFLIAIIMGPLASLALTALLWPVHLLGHWILSRIE
ncbi:MAG: hypothetical protein HYY44_08365 [Deltaproteobacteria bacterium]|nr:hypothetical protein [Deltaproteobacteria bacterium]